jgi:hypothetical protein
VTPFDLAYGTSIYAKLVATNVFGDSLESEAGNGAVIVTNPDSPLNIGEMPEYWSASSITIEWDEGVANGGKTVLDYRVSYALEGSNVYTVAVEQVT